MPSWRGLLLYPIGSISLGVIQDSVDFIRDSFNGMLDVYVVTQKTNPPLHHMDWDRLQYKAYELTVWLHDRSRSMVRSGYMVVGICDCDAYVEGLNFVFGLALPELGVATVYTRRLRSRDHGLYSYRLAKEVVHEAGHILGLGHCPEKGCVMSFSNTLDDVDRKSHRFCDKCLSRIRKNIS